jgi:hypothetical protein
MRHDANQLFAHRDITTEMREGEEGDIVTEWRERGRIH